MNQVPLLSHLTNLGVPSSTTQVANIRRSGQYGLGMNPATLDGNTAMITPPAIIRVIQAPLMYQRYDEMYGGQVIGMSQALTELLETYAKSVSGIDFGYSIDTETNPAGPSGQQIEDPTNTRRSDVSPVFTFTEITGNVIWNIFRQWVWDIQHPDSHISLAGSARMINAQQSSGRGRRARTRSQIAATIAVIQPDTTSNPDNMIGCSVITNLFPKDIGMFGYERTIGNSAQRERSITFSGLVIDNEMTHQLGMTLLAQANAARIDFNRRALGFSGVNATLTNSGLMREVAEELAAQSA